MYCSFYFKKIATVSLVFPIGIETVKVPVESLEKKNVFGSGQFENLTKKIKKNPNISAVFVSINLLRGIQRKYKHFILNSCILIPCCIRTSGS